ncbi:restriction endonuclease [Streptomyces globisporus]|uniref:restriction endonuclease n=1 Tax=Streptomyces globisporus TaxID=1908 RepID=UPI0037933D66
MHINWRTTVQLPDYGNGHLNELFQRHLSEATDDDLLAAYLHWTEGRIALDFWVAAEALVERFQSENESLDRLRTPHGSLYAGIYLSAREDLRHAIEQAIATTESTCLKARESRRSLCAQTRHDLAGRYRQADEKHPGRVAVALIGQLGEQNAEAEQAVRNALVRHRNEMYRVAILEQEMATFLASDGSFDLQDVDTMTPYEFEHMVARLARRDGLNVVRSSGGSRDLGADVIAVTAGELRIVFQCKHRHAGVGKVGSRDMQTLNGTARPEHQADIVIAVTNGTFTKPAIDFARSHTIHPLGRTDLRRWATWGDPLLSVLGVTDAPLTTAPGTPESDPSYVQAS